jgi:hypothetical protein
MSPKPIANHRREQNKQTKTKAKELICGEKGRGNCVVGNGERVSLKE